MRYLKPTANAHEVLEQARRTGLDETILAHGPNGAEVVAFEVGGRREPAIVVTAGAHADEPSGPFGALALLGELRTEHRVVVVPLRDPFAWDGFDAAIGFASGETVNLPDHDAAERFLRGSGTILLDEGGVLVVRIGELGFAFMRPAPDTVGPREIWSRLGEILPGRNDVIERLVGLRLVLPSNLADVEGCGAFARGYTVFITPSGRPGNLNRFFGAASPPAEVAAVQGLVDDVRPGLVLDLHEGQGSDFYVFAGNRLDDGGRAIVKAMIDAVRRDGHEVTTLERLAPRLSPSIVEKLESEVPGVLLGDLGEGDTLSSLGGYAWRYGPGFTTETGRWTSLGTRVQQQVVAVQGAVAAFERIHG